MNLANPGPKLGSSSCGQAGDCDGVFSVLQCFVTWSVNNCLQRNCCPRGFGANLAFGAQTLSGQGMQVSGSYFPLLGLNPALGRLLGPADDRAIGESPVVVLSHAYWQTRFNQDPGVLNQTLVVNGQPLTIVGVAPPGFEGITLGIKPQVFVPITMRGFMQPGFNAFDNRLNYWAYVFGRLRPDVSNEQARIGINVLYRAIINEVEAPNAPVSALRHGAFQGQGTSARTRPPRTKTAPNDARVPINLLLGVTGFVLLIVCVNMVNLMLVRGCGSQG